MKVKTRMKKIILPIILLLLSTYCFSQVIGEKSKILVGEFTIHADFLNDLKEGDTLMLMIARKPFMGMFKIGEDKTLYERKICEQTVSKRSKHDDWFCKIGFWEIDGEEVVFNLATRLISFKYLPLEPYSGRQFLIVTSIKSM